MDWGAWVPRLFVVGLAAVVAACSGGGESVSLTGSSMVGTVEGDTVELPGIDPESVTASLQVLSDEATGLAAVEEAAGLMQGEGHAAERCASASVALAAVSADELMEIAAAMPDEVLAGAYLAERAALLRIMQACAQGVPLPEIELERLAVVRELITVRVAALEGAG